MPYVLGVDIGNTTTTAAVTRWRATGWDAPEVVRLGAHSCSVRSVLHLDVAGEFTVEEMARDLDPARTARGFARRVGDDVPLIVGGEACPPEALTALLVLWVVEQAAAREGEAPDHVVFSHPASWGRHQRSALHQALRDLGLTRVTLLPEPVLVAERHTADGWAPDTLAVCAFGGTGYEASVVRRRDNSTFRVLGAVVAAEPAGGDDIDAALVEHVRAALGGELRKLREAGSAAGRLLHELGLECTRAKEQLATATETEVAVPLPPGGVAVPVTRQDLATVARPVVQAAAEAVGGALRAAGVDPAAAAGVLLAGGSAQLPLVSEHVAAELPGAPVVIAPEPRYTAAEGAALAAVKVVTPPPRRSAPYGEPAGPAPQRRPAAAAPPRPPVTITPLRLARTGARGLRLVGGRS